MRACAWIMPGTLLVTVGLAASPQGAGKVQGLADPDGLVARIDQRVQDWQPTSDERRFDEVGWAPDLCQALELAKKYDRPLFVFSYSGSDIREHAICLQRC
jgi:hypothetical protein